MNFSDLVGKTIKATRKLTLKGYDNEGYLLMEFTDGSKVIIISGYGRFTGCSVGEYKTLISIIGEDDGLDLGEYEIE